MCLIRSGNGRKSGAAPILTSASSSSNWPALCSGKADGGDRRAIMEKSRLYPSIVSNYCQLYCTISWWGQQWREANHIPLPSSGSCYSPTIASSPCIPILLLLPSSPSELTALICSSTNELMIIWIYTIASAILIKCLVSCKFLSCTG